MNIIRTPITNASAWRGEDMARRTDWIIHLKPEHITEIEKAMRAAMASGIEVTQLKREHFPIPGVVREIQRWSDELQTGRGFLVVRGLPVERYDDYEVRTIFWGLSLYMGSALSDRKSTRLNSSHVSESRMPSSA